MSETPPTRVFVRDLVLDANIGVHEREQGRRQRVRFNVDLFVRLPEGGPERDQLDDVLSYSGIVQGIRAIAEGGHINLVETLAERVARMALADPRVARVLVRVEKLDAYADATVGVEIERRQSAAQRSLRAASGD
ncbi:MAG: dihydroneopterin aldolase [Alphaproteobacteria bacterium]|nr:dihydroneopterin aldolase [Alphaproteobacteria bacterium]